MSFSFEKLLVYQKAIDFADQICTRTEQFPRGYVFLVDQLNRASLSIAANIAEGNGRFTKADRRNFLGIARGSVRECGRNAGIRGSSTLRTRTVVAFSKTRASAGVMSPALIFSAWRSRSARTFFTAVLSRHPVETSTMSPFPSR